MFFSSISSSFLTFQFDHSDTANLIEDPVSVTCKFVDCFACCLWRSGKSSEVRSSSYDCSSSSKLWSSLLLYAMLLGFLGNVNSSSSVTVGGSLSLVAQEIRGFHVMQVSLIITQVKK